MRLRALRACLPGLFARLAGLHEWIPKGDLSVLWGCPAFSSHQTPALHSPGAKQLATSRPVHGLASRGLSSSVPTVTTALGLSLRTSPLYSISKHCISTAAAAAAESVGSAASCGSVGVLAGKPSRIVDSRTAKSTGCSCADSCSTTSGRTADSDSGRSAGGAATKRRQPSLDRWRPPKQSKLGCSFRLISKDITACSSVTDLQQLVQQDGVHMNHINISAAVVTLQRLLGRCIPQQQQHVAQQAAHLIGQLWQLLQPQLPECEARQLANMIYSLCLLPTTLQQQYPWAVTQHLLPVFMEQLASAKPREISNVLYGTAASGQRLPGQSTQRLVDRLVATLPAANTQDIANAVWAVAKVQQQIKPMQLQQLLDTFRTISDEATPQQISNILYAVATMKQQVEEVQLTWLLSRLVAKLNDAVSQHFTNTMWACAEFGYLPQQLLTVPGMVDKLCAGSPQGLANTAFACGQLGHRDVQLMAALLDEVLSLAGNSMHHLGSKGFTTQTFTNFCWSLAVLDMRQQAPAVLSLVQAGQPLWASMTTQGLSQLHQAHMWLTDHNLAGGQGLAGVLTAQQLQQCQSAWQALLDAGSKSEVSPFQRSLFQVLRQVPIRWLVKPTMQQASLGVDGQPDGAAIIDIAARTSDGVWLAVEADGPTHFRQPDRGLAGPTLYRNRALAVRGYVVVSVPYYEWEDIQHSDRLKQQYLSDKIAAALQQAAADGPEQQRFAATGRPSTAE